ncbi:hypothetical protein JHK82_012418 [Glycine max]|nr:hypothetical protein JHK85_012769 [Glycine max]KAG5154449.1 hypothetical protein JHK82_012418 [Glycine max]
MKRDVILEMQHKNAARLPFFDRISEGLPPGFEKKMSTKDREEKEMITESFKFGFEDSLEAIRGVISILPTEYAEDYQNRNILSDYAREDYFDDPYLCPKQFLRHDVNRRPTRSTFRQDTAAKVHEDVGDFSHDEDHTSSEIAFYQDVIGEELLEGEMLSSDEEYDSLGDESDPSKDMTLP